jgi:serine protease DegS
VQRSGPAAAAGLQPGDVIVGLDGDPAGNAIEIMNAIAERRPGQQVKLHIDRAGRQLSLQVEVQERPQR